MIRDIQIQTQHPPKVICQMVLTCQQALHLRCKPHFKIIKLVIFLIKRLDKCQDTIIPPRCKETSSCRGQVNLPQTMEMQQKISCFFITKTTKIPMETSAPSKGPSFPSLHQVAFSTTIVYPYIRCPLGITFSIKDQICSNNSSSNKYRMIRL